jgi:hypothetical protein
VFFKFNSISLQSLWFDTLNIALSYGIRSIASGNFIIDILVNETPHQYIQQTIKPYAWYIVPIEKFNKSIHITKDNVYQI